MLYTMIWLLGQILLAAGLVKRFGLENIPSRGGVILASNHQSFSDPPVIGISICQQAHFLAKEELYRNRLFGWLLSLLNTVPVKRAALDPRTYRNAIKLLLSGKTLVLFPEGTRSRGEEFLEPKLGVGLLALEARVPVVPVYLENTKSMWTTVANRQKVRVSFGQPITTSWLQDVPRNKAGYRLVAREVMKRIEDLKRTASS